MQNQPFDDIRPYHDDEVRPVLEALLHNDTLLNAIIRFKLPWLPFGFGVGRVLLRQKLRKEVQNIRNVRDFQMLIKGFMDHAITKSTTNLTCSGLDELPTDQACLFISNHRDIALDPAFVNYMLHQNGHDTVQIAIGDNLLDTPWIADIMRLNRCFMVKRSAETNREKLKNSKQLSAYIAHALHEQKNHIWIAQREGRAKDGKDLTNPALVSMLGMNRPKTMEFKDYIHSLNICPVSISYEFDPCDEAKAKEVAERLEKGEYEKEDHEDIQSIIKGITGPKGHVHLHFCQPLKGDYENAKDVAQDLDQAILSHYQLMPSNIEAYNRLHQDKPMGSESDLTGAARYFDIKAGELSQSEASQLLQMYANPIMTLQALNESA